MKKLEHFTVQKVTGDGRCMFRALVRIFSIWLVKIELERANSGFFVFVLSL